MLPQEPTGLAIFIRACNTTSNPPHASQMLSPQWILYVKNIYQMQSQVLIGPEGLQLLQLETTRKTGSSGIEPNPVDNRVN